MLSSRGSSQPRDQTQVSHIAGGFFTTRPTWEARARDGVPLSGGSPHGDFSEASNIAGGEGASWGPGEQKETRELTVPLILLFSLHGKYPAYLCLQCRPLC